MIHFCLDKLIHLNSAKLELAGTVYGGIIIIHAEGVWASGLARAK
jgi:hypothetical protein